MSQSDDPRERVQGQPPRRPAPAPQPREDEDEYDEEEPRARRRGDSYSGVVPYRNGMALAGYYCGFAGLILILGSFAVGMALAPRPIAGLLTLIMLGAGALCALLAIVFGILGMSYAGRNPGAKGTAHAVVGLVFGILELVGLIALFLIGFAAVSRIR